MGQRIKGQEVELLVVLDGKPQTNITTIKDFEFTPELEILDEGYLGQTTNQKDSVFTGLAGKFSMHFDNQDILKFMASVIDKARRRTPGTKINIKATLNFPNGQRPRVMIPDCEFGDFPVNFGSRKDFGSVSLTFAAAEVQFLF